MDTARTPRGFLRDHGGRVPKGTTQRLSCLHLTLSAAAKTPHWYPLVCSGQQSAGNHREEILILPIDFLLLPIEFRGYF